jgi:hydrogenase maturation protein HypF
VNCPPAHGAGRWFDAVGALALARPLARYEGQVAMALDAAAGDAGAGAGAEPYPVELDRSPRVPELDLRPLARAVLGDVALGRDPGLVSARFHAALAAGAAALVEHAASGHGRLPVVLTGGVFQNARLAEGVALRLTPRHEVYLHSLVPPGDGGIALGQALIADAALRR